MLLHVVCCAVTSGEKVDVSCNVFFVGVVCSKPRWDLVCKWVCRSVGLVSASCVFQVWCIGSGCTDACVVPV